MRRFNKAFTLTELLIALGVVAILCAILLPIIFNLMPNQNVIMAKRAFYTTQTVIADMINSDSCYPDKTSAISADDKRIGFDDGFGYPNCDKWGGSENTDTIETEGDATTKFVTLFADKLGVEPTIGESDATIDTPDGMKWKFTSANFSNADDDGGSIELTVDVNGTDDGPNCGSTDGYSTEFGSGGENCSTKTNLDRFKMTINGNGKITISDLWAQNAVKVNKNITEER